MKNIRLLLLLFVFVSCERVKYFPDRPIFCDKTNILAHKGGGSFDEGNTLEACKYGLALFDGIECDIQRSSDNKLWLSHSPNISSCGSFNSTCFASLTSNSIIQIDSCLGNNINYTQLETIFDYMSRNYPDKYISLDVKAWTPCGISGANITKQMNEMAREIISLTVQYHMENKVMVESETGDFLYYLKTHTNFIETYLTAFGDFELGFSRALDAGFSGISFKYNFKETIGKEHIDLLHRKGLKIQVWTVNDIDEVLLLKPDFIQTDNVGYNMNSSNL